MSTISTNAYGDIDLQSYAWNWNVPSGKSNEFFGFTFQTADSKGNTKYYTFIPDEFISKGYVSSNGKQYYSNFFNNSTLENLYTKYQPIDFGGFKDFSGSNGFYDTLKSQGYGTSGVLVPEDWTVQNYASTPGLTSYTIGKQVGNVTVGAIQGIGLKDGNAVYVPKASGADSASAYILGKTTYSMWQPELKWYQKLAQEIAQIPLFPEIASLAVAAVGGEAYAPYVYAALKGAALGAQGVDPLKAGLMVGINLGAQNLAANTDFAKSIGASFGASSSAAQLAIGKAVIGAGVNGVRASLAGGDVTQAMITGALTAGGGATVAEFSKSILGSGYQDFVNKISSSTNLTSTQVQTLIASSFVSGIASEIKGGDFANTFKSNLIAGGVGQSLANQVESSLSSTVSAEARKAIVTGTATVAGTAATALINGQDINKALETNLPSIIYSTMSSYNEQVKKETDAKNAGWKDFTEQAVAQAKYGNTITPSDYKTNEQFIKDVKDFTFNASSAESLDQAKQMAINAGYNTFYGPDKKIYTVGGQSLSSMDTFVQAMAPGFNPEEYKKLNGLAATVNAADHYITTGQYNNLPVSYEQYVDKALSKIPEYNKDLYKEETTAAINAVKNGDFAKVDEIAKAIDASWTTDAEARQIFKSTFESIGLTEKEPTNEQIASIKGKNLEDANRLAQDQVVLDAGIPKNYQFNSQQEKIDFAKQFVSDVKQAATDSQTASDNLKKNVVYDLENSLRQEGYSDSDISKLYSSGQFSKLVDQQLAAYKTNVENLQEIAKEAASQYGYESSKYLNARKNVLDAMVSTGGYGITKKSDGTYFSEDFGEFDPNTLRPKFIPNYSYSDSGGGYRDPVTGILRIPIFIETFGVPSAETPYAGLFAIGQSAKPPEQGGQYLFGEGSGSVGGASPLKDFFGGFNLVAIDDKSGASLYESGTGKSLILYSNGSGLTVDPTTKEPIWLTPTQIEEIKSDIQTSGQAPADAIAAAKADIQSKVDAGYINAEEATKILQDKGFTGVTSEDIAKITGIVSDQTTTENLITENIDPFYTTQAEVEQLYKDLGISNPTTADIQKFVGKYTPEEAAIAIKDYLPTAQYNAVIEGLKQIDTIKSSLSDAIDEAKKAGLTGDAALQSAIDKVSTDLGTTKTELLDQLGKTESTLREDFATKILSFGSEIDARIDELESQGLDRYTATQAAIGELSAKTEADKQALQDQIAANEAARQQQIAEEKAAASRKGLLEKAAGFIPGLTIGAPALAGAAPTVDETAKFKKPFITSTTKQEEFKGPLEEFIKGVEKDSYTETPYLDSQTLTDQEQQGESSMPDYFTYGQQTDINQLFDPFGKGATEMSQFEQPMMAKQGGLATPLMASGGQIGYYAHGGLPMVAHSGKVRVDFRDGAAVGGPGDGQSDDIPAMLADGEFVFPADVVAALGNGSTKAGSEKLYDMMHSIRAYHRSARPQDLPPPAKKNPLDYLKKSTRKARR